MFVNAPSSLGVSLDEMMRRWCARHSHDTKDRGLSCKSNQVGGIALWPGNCTPPYQGLLVRQAVTLNVAKERAPKLFTAQGHGLQARDGAMTY